MMWVCPLVDDIHFNPGEVGISQTSLVLRIFLYLLYVTSGSWRVALKPCGYLVPGQLPPSGAAFFGCFFTLLCCCHHPLSSAFFPPGGFGSGCRINTGSVHTISWSQIP